MHSANQRDAVIPFSSIGKLKENEGEFGAKPPSFHLFHLISPKFKVHSPHIHTPEFDAIFRVMGVHSRAQALLKTAGRGSGEESNKEKCIKKIGIYAEPRKIVPFDNNSGIDTEWQIMEDTFGIISTIIDYQVISWYTYYMMKPALYIETTIAGYVTGKKSKDVVIRAHQHITLLWWKNFRQNYALFTSDVVVGESGRIKVPILKCLVEFTGLPCYNRENDSHLRSIRVRPDRYRERMNTDDTRHISPGPTRFINACRESHCSRQRA